MANFTGTNVYDQSYLVGRVIEVNYKTSRVLLLSDLNSNVPVTIAPQNIQAIITGDGDRGAQIKYIKKGISDEINEESIIYTSGTGDIFKSGVPIGKLKIKDINKSKKFNVEFFNDFSQLKYVFAEVITTLEIDKNEQTKENNNQNTTDSKLKILEDELKIIEKSNLRFKDENENLKTQINDLNIKILNFKNEIFNQKETINQFNIDTKELEFLRLNLDYGHKCRKSFFNNKGFKIGTNEYKKCVLNRGRIDD